jgi:hypothetical protein
VLDDEEAVLGELQNEDERASTEAVENDVAHGAAAGVLSRFAGRVHGGMIAEDERVWEVRLQIQKRWQSHSFGRLRASRTPKWEGQHAKLGTGDAMRGHG